MPDVMMEIIERLAPLDRVFCSDGNDKAIKILNEYLAFKPIKYLPENEFNGWTISPCWNVNRAVITDENGNVLLDGTKNVLSVIALSRAFSGRISVGELKKHLHYDHRNDDAIPYHSRQMYRCWDRDWGFCVTKRFYDSLNGTDYIVEIETDERPGDLQILEYTKRGEFDLTYYILAHLDHRGMANDDLSGCAVGIELMRRLSSIKTKLTYKLLLVPEIIGSEYYLHYTQSSKEQRALEGIFLESLGTDTPLGLQLSLNKNSATEMILQDIMSERGLSYRTTGCGEIITNDEYVWEVYGIPMPSLTRHPFPEYHSSLDNISIISSSALEESVAIMTDFATKFDREKFIFKNFTGNICLSNPKYDLYIDDSQEAFGESLDDHAHKMRKLIGMIPLLHRPVSVLSLGRICGLKMVEVEECLERWHKKGLLQTQ